MERSEVVISADSHINEPPDLWVERLAASMRDRAPRMQRFEDGDAWIMPGALDPINFGTNCSAGLAPDERREWICWEEVGAAGHRPDARIEAQELDGVAAEVIYPTPRIACALAWQREDEALHLSCIRAYNDWLSEFCAHNPARLWGSAMLPNVGAAAAAAELDRVIGLPGIRGALLARYPNGEETLAAEDDAVWGRAAEAGLPISIHVTFATHPQGIKARGKLTSDLRILDAPIRASQFIFGGVFDRFPSLRLVLAEVDAAWIPYFREQLDDRFERTSSVLRHAIRRRPSDYFTDNISSTFITDCYGLRNRYEIGVSQMLWSNDFPHSGSNWPNSSARIDEQFAGMPPAERQAILAGNALRIYNVDNFFSFGPNREKLCNF